MFFMKKVKFLNRKNVNRKWLPQKFIFEKTLSQMKFGTGKSWKLLILLTSFLFGNLFGINFSGINWNFSLIFFIVLFFECLNFLISRNFVSVPKTCFGEQIKFGKKFITKTSFFSKKKNLGKDLQLKNKNQLPIATDLPGTKISFGKGNHSFTGFETMKTVLESFRRGFLLGIFVEAFKVGS